MLVEEMHKLNKYFISMNEAVSCKLIEEVLKGEDRVQDNAPYTIGIQYCNGIPYRRPIICAPEKDFLISTLPVGVFEYSLVFERCEFRWNLLEKTVHLCFSPLTVSFCEGYDIIRSGPRPHIVCNVGVSMIFKQSHTRGRAWQISSPFLVESSIGTAYYAFSICPKRPYKSIECIWKTIQLWYSVIYPTRIEADDIEVPGIGHRLARVGRRVNIRVDYVLDLFTLFEKGLDARCSRSTYSKSSTACGLRVLAYSPGLKIIAPPYLGSVTATFAGRLITAKSISSELELLLLQSKGKSKRAHLWPAKQSWYIIVRDGPIYKMSG